MTGIDDTGRKASPAPGVRDMPDWRCAMEGGLGNDADGAIQNGVIILDDDPGMRSSLCFFLRAHGYGVTDYAHPAPLFGDLAGTAPVCAIIDIHMPGTDGLLIGRRLQDMHPDLPMIFITGRADQRIRDGVSDLGAVALLEKPFSGASLIEAIREGVEAAQGAQPFSIN